MSNGDPRTGEKGEKWKGVLLGAAMLLVLLGVWIYLQARPVAPPQPPPAAPDRHKLLVAPVRIDVDSLGIGVEDYRLPARADYHDVPRLVLAFYYPWFGTPTGAGGCGHWRHWLHGGPEPTEGNICISNRCPLLGPYDSYDPELIDQHCRWGKQAGIDSWILSWWALGWEGEYEDLAVVKVLDGCQRNEMTACIHYESYVDPIAAETLIHEVGTALKNYGGHPAYLKVAGRPVVFVYARAIDALGMARTCQALKQINDAYPGGVVFFGDQFSRTAARLFNGLYGYIPAPELVGLSPEKARQWADVNYGKWVRLTERAGCISTLTVIPGYDDTLIRDPGFKVERYDGALYRALWEAAIEADPQWILITTFNEWSEGSEIEPSREEKTLYLDLTAEYVRRFKAAPRRIREPAAEELDETQIASLRQKIEQLNVAVLPGADSQAIWWLVNRLGVEPQIVRWQELVAGKLRADGFDVLLYAGNEHYRQTVRSAEDVDAAIRQYLDAGGLLLALPSRPMPFFYNQDGKEVDSAKKFGLSLENAWDTPPAGKVLEFVQPGDTLPHLPDRMPYPTDGDRRWRPIVPKGYLHYESLLQLRDQTGESHGGAVAYAELPEGGRVLYAWFRLLDCPHADALLYDLFEFIAEQAGTEGGKGKAEGGRGKGDST